MRAEGGELECGEGGAVRYRAGVATGARKTTSTKKKGTTTAKDATVVANRFPKQPCATSSISPKDATKKMNLTSLQHTHNKNEIHNSEQKVNVHMHFILLSLPRETCSKTNLTIIRVPCDRK